MLRMENVDSLITQAGLRPTKARLAVLKTITESSSALSHAEILERLAGLKEFDRVTVYRVLDWLTENQLVHKISGDNRAWKFQLSQPKFSGTHQTERKAVGQDAHHHAHLHCIHCGKISCLHDVKPRFNQEILKHYQVSQIEINLKGVCIDCANLHPSK